MGNIDHDNFEPHGLRTMFRSIVAVWIIGGILSAATSIAAIYALYAGAKWLLAHS